MVFLNADLLEPAVYGVDAVVVQYEPAKFSQLWLAGHCKGLGDFVG